MNGVLLLGEDRVIRSQVERMGIAVELGDRPALPFDRTLIIAPRTRLPFYLLPAAFGLLEAWDAAVPLYRYDTTAESVGSAADRETTRAVIRDLRVLCHAVELLFVQRNAAGQALVENWLDQMAAGGDRRLAFLRAFYLVKPRLCVLPTSWLVDARKLKRAPNPAAPPQGSAAPLVRLELLPGQFVKVRAGTEAQVREQFKQRQSRRKVR